LQKVIYTETTVRSLTGLENGRGRKGRLVGASRVRKQKGSRRNAVGSSMRQQERKSKGGSGLGTKKTRRKEMPALSRGLQRKYRVA